MVAGSGRRAKTAYVCQACGHQCAKWLGRCPGCEAWGTFEQETVASPAATGVGGATGAAAVVALDTLSLPDAPRTSCGLGELDRVLGGGLVAGALILVGGDPGIGKSTLLLQVAMALAKAGGRVLYVTGEESPAQVSLRAARLGPSTPGLFLCPATDTQSMAQARAQVRPTAMVVDSIQTVYDPQVPSSPGSVAQIRGVTQTLVAWAKGSNLPIFVVGHVTKDGAIAGPRVMEHMVDTVLYFEGERSGAYRILRAHKNRFGSAQEMAVFEMRADGLSAVTNPSAFFLAQRAEGPGACVVTSLEGTRPLLLEVQALVTAAFGGGTPRRTTTGFDPQRTAMLCAVLGARAGLDLGGHDVFVNVAGGVRVQEPAADLGVVLALASAARQHALPHDWVAIGEVGLAGEVRAAQSMSQRLLEASRLGFTAAVVPEAWARDVSGKQPLQLKAVPHVRAALSTCGVPARRPRGAGSRSPPPTDLGPGFAADDG